MAVNSDKSSAFVLHGCQDLPAAHVPYTARPIFLLGKKAEEDPPADVCADLPTTAPAQPERSLGLSQPPMPMASSKRQKALFSASLISPMANAGIFLFGKDIYVLKFAADVGLMGLVGTLLSVSGPAFQPLVGYCMEKLSLEKYFPWDSWGRRAPWFLTHCIAGAFTCAAIFVPPSFDSTFLCFWFLGWSLLGSWFLSVVFVAIESSRVEVYPTKEERSEVEAAAKIMSGIGAGIGMGLPLVVAAEAPVHLLALMSVATLISGLVSIIALPVLRKARMPFDDKHVSSFLGEFMGLIKIPVVRHLIAYRMVEEVVTMTAVTASLYYLTFVEGLMGVDRSIYMLICGVVMGVGTVLMLPCWTQFFRLRRRGVNINVICGRIVALGVLSPLALVAGDLLPRGLGFVVYIFFLQASLTGQTFWRSIALGWVVDEDCHACDGRRREAMFVGLIGFFSAIGRAVGVGIVLYGLAICGMDMVNCDLQCQDQAAAIVSDCVKRCDVENIVRQPQCVRIYLRVVYIALVTAFQAVAAVLVYTFPIYGARLDAIYDKQADLVTTVVVVGATPPEASKGDPVAGAWDEQNGTGSSQGQDRCHHVD